MREGRTYATAEGSSPAAYARRRADRRGSETSLALMEELGAESHA